MRTVSMTISTNAVDAAFVLKSMTDLYANKRLAPIREITTNALDAHIAAGQSRPVEVTLPSRDNGYYFKVKDFGTGLDWDDLENIYAQFGRSTKRETNEQTGMLGFGCKSPLTYCDAFAITTVKNGIKYVASVSKGVTGIGEIHLLSEVPTTAPNGVTVKMPVPPEDLLNFLNDAQQFYRFQREGVLVDGEWPEVIECLLPLDPDVWVIGTTVSQGYRTNKSFLVQGGVPYPYDTPSGLPNTVAWVPNGMVTFPPSREALQNSETTEWTLEQTREFVHSTLVRMVDFVLDSATTAYEFYSLRYKLRAELPSSFKHKRLAYRSNERLWITDDPVTGQDRFCWYVNHGKAARENLLEPQHLTPNSRVTFIRNFTPRSVSARHKEMIEAHGISEPYLLLPPKPGFDISGFPGCKWDDIPPLPRKPRQKSVPGQPRQGVTKYQIWHSGGQWEATPQYTGTGVLTYVDNNETKAHSESTRYPQIAVASIKVGLQKDRFLRLHPHAVPFRDWHKEEARRMHKALTRSDLDLLECKDWQRHMAAHMGKEIANIKDRNLRSLLAACGTASPALTWLCDVTRQEGTYYLSDALGGGDAIKDLVSKIEDAGTAPYRVHLDDATLLADYPMLQIMAGYTATFPSIPATEWVIYFNARHRENTKATGPTVAPAADDMDDIWIV